MRGNKLQEEMCSTLQATFYSLFSITAETNTVLALPRTINRINSWYNCGITLLPGPSLPLLGRKHGAKSPGVNK